jgi:hypothetical protein
MNNPFLVCGSQPLCGLHCVIYNEWMAPTVCVDEEFHLPEDTPHNLVGADTPRACSDGSRRLQLASCSSRPIRFLSAEKRWAER